MKKKVIALCVCSIFLFQLVSPVGASPGLRPTEETTKKYFTVKALQSTHEADFELFIAHIQEEMAYADPETYEQRIRELGDIYLQYEKKPASVPIRAWTMWHRTFTRLQDDYTRDRQLIQLNRLMYGVVELGIAAFVIGSAALGDKIKRAWNAVYKEYRPNAFKILRGKIETCEKRIAAADKRILERGPRLARGGKEDVAKKAEKLAAEIRAEIRVGHWREGGVETVSHKTDFAPKITVTAEGTMFEYPWNMTKKKFEKWMAEAEKKEAARAKKINDGLKEKSLYIKDLRRDAYGYLGERSQWARELANQKRNIDGLPFLPGTYKWETWKTDLERGRNDRFPRMGFGSWTSWEGLQKKFLGTLSGRSLLGFPGPRRVNIDMAPHTYTNNIKVLFAEVQGRLAAVESTGAIPRVFTDAWQEAFNAKAGEEALQKVLNRWYETRARPGHRKPLVDTPLENLSPKELINLYRWMKGRVRVFETNFWSKLWYKRPLKRSKDWEKFFFWDRLIWKRSIQGVPDVYPVAVGIGALGAVTLWKKARPEHFWFPANSKVWVGELRRSPVEIMEDHIGGDFFDRYIVPFDIEESEDKALSSSMEATQELQFSLNEDFLEGATKALIANEAIEDVFDTFPDYGELQTPLLPLPVGDWEWGLSHPEDYDSVRFELDETEIIGEEG